MIKAVYCSIREILNKRPPWPVCSTVYIFKGGQLISAAAAVLCGSCPPSLGQRAAAPAAVCCPSCDAIGRHKRRAWQPSWLAQGKTVTPHYFPHNKTKVHLQGFLREVFFCINFLC